MSPLVNTDKFIPEQYYHLYNHAVGSDNLFRNRDNFLYFLTKFKDYITPVCKCYAYCLMPNHFHFLLQIRTFEELDLFQLKRKPDSDIANLDYHKVVMNQLSRMLNGYAQAYNRMFERKGALFLDYTRRKEVLSDKYLNNLIYYIHHNPVHHNICTDIRDWEFSSYHSLCSYKSTVLERASVISGFGLKNDFEDFHIRNQDRTGFLQEFEF